MAIIRGIFSLSLVVYKVIKILFVCHELQGNKKTIILIIIIIIVILECSTSF